MAGKILDNFSETETAMEIGRFWICERTEINHVEGWNNTMMDQDPQGGMR